MRPNNDIFNRLGPTGVSAYRPGESDGVHRLRQRLSLTLNAIRDRAFANWVAAGRPPGDNLRFWLEAEQELLRDSDQKVPR